MLSQWLQKDEYSDRVNSRRIDFLFEHYRLASYWTSLAGIVSFYLLYTDKNKTILTIWLVLIILLNVIRILFFKLLQKRRKKGDKRHSFYLLILLFFILLSGTLWGVGVYLFLPGIDQPELFLYFISIVIVISSGSASSGAASSLCGLAFITPVFIGILIRINQLEYQLFFYGLSLYYIFVTSFIFRLNSMTTNVVGLDIENAELIKAVTKEKNIAEQANIAKSQFLAAASHDLRQPLNSMGLFLYTLRKKIETTKEKESLELLTHIDDSYSALNQLFDALLVISRLDAGTIEVENKVIQLGAVLESLVTDRKESAQVKNLVLNHKASDFHVYADPILLTRIISNLIDNAIKYTHQGKIDILEVSDGDYIEIHICDTGIGIPEKDFDHIFNEYHQLANEKRDRRQGIGLGLSIVKKMCHVIDATISVSSVVGEGSTFILRMKSVTAEKRPHHIQILQKELHSFNGLKVLVLDDEPNILYAMELLLKSWQCQVNTAESYQQALKIALKEQPELILCDYRLDTNMTGLEAITALQLELMEQIPTIIITGDTDPNILKRIQEEGGVLLSKPIHPIKLQAEIIKVMKG